jgi:hypothetical protein
MLQLEDFHDIHIQQVGRASWMCHSAKRVPREFPATFCIRMLSMRPLAEIMAFWTQRIKRADYMHVTALKIPDLGSRTSCVGASEK